MGGTENRGGNSAMTWMEWYDTLTKPLWTPSPATIGLIWTILYPVIAVSFGFVFVRAYQGKIPQRVAAPFAINLVANLLFMPIFAGLRSVPLATVDILIVWSTIVWCAGRGLVALPMGGAGAGALFRLGVDCDPASIVDRLDKSLKRTERHTHPRTAPASTHWPGIGDGVASY